MLRPQAKPLDLGGKPDLKDPDLYQHKDFWEAFRQLRAEDPVYWNPEAEGSGFWAITKYDDIEMISKNPKLFSSAREMGGHRIFNEYELESDATDATMISMDPPVHSAYRRMISPGFVPRRIVNMEERIRARVTRLIDEMIAKHPNGEADFVSSIAAPLPIEVLAELFGVPEADGPKLFEWSNATVGEDDPELRVSDEYMRQCVAEMAMYAARLWEERAEKPGEDLISMLVHSRVNDEPMTFPAYIGAFILLVVAGNETTRNSISGGLMALSQHPEQKQKLLDDPLLIPSAAQEIVRWVSPVLHMRRTATEDTELRGKTIKRGDKIVMWYASGNRDEEAWPDADVFDVTRYTRKDARTHISFGAGQHFCLGSRLAELQLKVLYEELLARLPDIEVAGEARRLRSNFISGIKDMPVRFSV